MKKFSKLQRKLDKESKLKNLGHTQNLEINFQNTSCIYYAENCQFYTRKYKTEKKYFFKKYKDCIFSRAAYFISDSKIKNIVLQPTRSP